MCFQPTANGVKQQAHAYATTLDLSLASSLFGQVGRNAADATLPLGQQCTQRG